MAKCECGNDRFIGRFRYYGSCITDGNNNWEKDLEVDDAEFYGPYTCTECHKETDNFPEEKK